MALQVAADLVVAVAEAVGKEAAFGVEQQARGLGGAAGDDNDVGRLLLQVAAGRQNKLTPVARPRSSVRISFTMHSVRSSQLPVLRAMGITVFCEPFLASTSQANPQHQRQRMQGPRPL